MATPDGPSTQRAFKEVQSWSGEQIRARIEAEVGDEVLAAFHALAHALAPGDGEDETARKVQLLIFGYLMRCELEPRALSGPPATPPPPSSPPSATR